MKTNHKWVVAGYNRVDSWYLFDKLNDALWFAKIVYPKHPHIAIGSWKMGGLR